VIAFMQQDNGTIDPGLFRALSMVLISLVCLFVTIIMGSLLAQTIRVAARDAEKLLRRDWLPSLPKT
jgi:hypothetical protein